MQLTENFYYLLASPIHNSSCSLFRTTMSSSSFKCINTIVVPTKGEDNCSYAAYTSKLEDVDVDDTFDAFSYYSSDLIRLKTLLLSDDDSSNDDDDLSAMTAVNNALRSAGLNTLQSSSNNQVMIGKVVSTRCRPMSCYLLVVVCISSPLLLAGLKCVGR